MRLKSSIGASPASDISTIRKRAGLASVSDITLSQIQRERIHELAFEGGFFFFDGKRLHQKLYNLDWTANYLVFPISLTELNANPKLVQNPGYGTH